MKIAWADIETTGLDPEGDLILELALIISDQNLEVLEERSWVIRPNASPEEVRGRMNDWVLKTHTDSRLIEELASGVSLGDVDRSASEIIASHGGKYKLILAGSSPHFDRSFFRAQMPLVDKALHYRHFDTSTMERAFEWWRPDLRQPRDGRSVAHRALDDIRWSLDCARYYQRVIRSLKAEEDRDVESLIAYAEGYSDGRSPDKAPAVKWHPGHGEKLPLPGDPP